MATEKWVAVKNEWCDLIGKEVELLELRVYPADVLPEGQDFQVKARRCSVDVTCNMAGFPCKWAFTNPDIDGFQERERDRDNE